MLEPACCMQCAEEPCRCSTKPYTCATRARAVQAELNIRTDQATDPYARVTVADGEDVASSFLVSPRRLV